MAYEAKTNWKLDDTVMPEDLNRIEQGIFNAEELATVGSIKVLEASTENVIDFNTLIEPGIYLIKNCSDGGGTTLNSNILTSTNVIRFSDVMLYVREFITDTGVKYTYQESTMQTGKNHLYRNRKESENWTEWTSYNVAGKSTYTATIPTTGWSKPSSLNGGGYISITVSGLTISDNPIVSPKYAGRYDTDVPMSEEWNKISRIATENDKLFVYAYEEIPTVEIPIQIMCIR